MMFELELQGMEEKLLPLGTRGAQIIGTRWFYQRIPLFEMEVNQSHQ